MAETSLNKTAIGLKDTILPAAMVVALLFMIFPLPSATLDVGLALNLAFSFLILLITFVVAGGLAQISQGLIVIPGIAAALVFLYLGINQKFLPWIALLQKGNPIDTIQRGRAGVDPSWWWLLLLLIVESLILLVGLLLCGVGLLAAAPVVICISTAAYRQLFGTDDAREFLN